MKKLLAICFALAIGVSACTFDPVPEPAHGWTYVQAIHADGTPLCDLLPGQHPFYGIGSGIVFENGVNAKLTEKYVEIGTEVNTTAKVKIETTLPLISLLPSEVTHYVALDEDFVGLHPIPNIDVVVEEVGDKVIVNFTNGDEKFFCITYHRRVFDLYYYQLVMPTFTQEVEVKVLKAGWHGDYVVHVKAKGSGAGIIDTDPCFTGFKIKFVALPD